MALLRNKLSVTIGIILLFLTLITIPSLSIKQDEIMMDSFPNPLENSNNDTHTILVEIASSQGCSGCHDWNNFIYDEFINGSIEFQFVEMIVYDHNWDVLNNQSYDWNNHYGITSYPTSVFDGGYVQYVGSNPQNLPEMLEHCKNRTVSDIDAVVNVTWIDPAVLNISVQITNNMGKVFSGYIRSHITEIISRYTTNFGKNYHNGFLDFAFYHNISIPAYGTYTNITLWNGSLHQDEHGDSFSDIVKNNTKVYLGVFDEKGFCEETVVSFPYGAQGLIDINQSMQDRGFPIRHTIDGDWAAAQNFLPTVDLMTQVELSLRKFGTPEFNLTVELREGHPQGTLVDTRVFTPDEVSSSWEWFNVDFEDIMILPGTEYFIVCPPAPSGVTTSFGYEWGYVIDDIYEDGAFWFTRDGGGLWRDLPTMYDFSFRIYGYH